MKLVRFGLQGQERPGLIDADGAVRDLSRHVPDIDGASLSPEGLARLRAIDPITLPLAPAGTRLGAPVAGTQCFACIGLNYVDHAAEANLPLPEEPVIFLKAPGSICGPNDPILIPPGSEKTDWEVELAVVIGTTARNVPASSALDHVAGYTLCNEVSERAWQMERGGTWSKGKSFDNFGQLGPYLVIADSIDDPQDLTLTLWVDGVRLQHASTANMIFSVAQLVSYVSTFMTLHPGDIVSTGTPAGVGMGQIPPRFLSPSQVVELYCPELGRQNHLCVAYGTG